MKHIRIHQVVSDKVLNLGQFGMTETCENWLGLVNISVYYAPKPVKFPGTALLGVFRSSLGALSKQYLVNVVLI